MSFITNLDELKALSIGSGLEKVDFIFRVLLKSLKEHLSLEPLFKIAKVSISEENISSRESKINPFDVAVKRITINDNLQILVSKDFISFLPFILLREALYSFTQFKNFSIQVAINSIVENIFTKNNLLKDWKLMIRNSIIHDADIINALAALDKFFKRKVDNSKDSLIFFFNYIRNNAAARNEDLDGFLKHMQSKYFSSNLESLYNDEMIETIRILIKIFYEIKSYTSLVDYQNYFKKFKENKIINTKLSLRKFISNMRWISLHSQLSPSYQVRWNAIDVSINICYLKFHPKFHKERIYKIIYNLPFCVIPKISYSNFSCEMFGFFIIPRVYLKDLIRLLERMENKGYLIKKYIFIVNIYSFFNNLNYFREFVKNKRIVDLDNKEYDPNYEIKFRLTYGQKFFRRDLSLLDFLILDRIRFFSSNSLGFERRSKTLDELKTDLMDEVIYQRNLVENLKKYVLECFNNNKSRNGFIKLLKNNQNFGFFHLRDILSTNLLIMNLIRKTHALEPNIIDSKTFYDYIREYGISPHIEENLILKKRKILNDYVKIFNESKKKFEKIHDQTKLYSEIINICNKIKIFNLNSIKEIIDNPQIIDNIHDTKESKLNEMYKAFKPRDITIKEVEDKINEFLNNKPPIIKPLLINTFIYSHISNYYPIFLLKKTIETEKLLHELKKLFPSILIDDSIEYFSKEEIMYVEIYVPNLKSKEKNHFFSIIFNLFGENVILANRYFHSGYIPVFSIKSFYDLKRKKFFYTKDLFNQYFLGVKNLLGEVQKVSVDQPNKLQRKLWSREKNLINLAKIVNNRVARENNVFDIIPLKKLLNLHLNLKSYLLSREKFMDFKVEFYFRNFIKSIKFIPAFRFFGLGQYFLYVFPKNLNEIDFRLLFLNTFQKIYYPASIDNSIPLFIKYIKPHDMPNLKYLHWLTKSKKTIREYCGFFIQKVYHIMHFDYNISKEGWIYDSENFKMHMQNILFNPSHSIKIPQIKEYKINDKLISSSLGPNFPEIDSLSQIYNWHPIDIKSFLGTKKISTINQITSLLKKNLIFPYLSLKNLDLQERIYIIIPNLKQELISTIVKIFSFFNLAFIYEIKGEYFIHGFDQEVKFQNGLMIKLYFPKCEISEFLGVFDLLFEYLEIKDYIILNDLVDGKNLIKSIYGGLDFLKSYNPLKNLEWNKQKKRWMNPKVFTSKFEPIYPDLIPKDKR